jgi:hypothetical protein
MLAGTAWGKGLMFPELQSDAIRIMRAPSGIERWRDAPQRAARVLKWAKELSRQEIWLTQSHVFAINAAAEFLGTGRRLRVSGFIGNGSEIHKQVYTVSQIQYVLGCDEVTR